MQSSFLERRSLSIFLRPMKSLKTSKMWVVGIPVTLYWGLYLYITLISVVFIDLHALSIRDIRIVTSSTQYPNRPHFITPSSGIKGGRQAQPHGHCFMFTQHGKDDRQNKIRKLGKKVRVWVHGAKGEGKERWKGFLL